VKLSDKLKTEAMELHPHFSIGNTIFNPGLYFRLRFVNLPE